MCVRTLYSYHDQLEAAPQTTERSSYRVWFHLECIVAAAPPDHVLTLSTPALSSTTLHLTIPNPHPQSLTLEVNEMRALTLNSIDKLHLLVVCVGLG